METETLEKIGLTKNESIVYLTLVKSGSIKTAEILKKSGLNSGRIYDTLESLKHKGLVSESSINGVKHFTASPPDQLKDYFQQRLNQLNKNSLGLLLMDKQLKNLNLAIKIDFLADSR